MAFILACRDGTGSHLGQRTSAPAEVGNNGWSKDFMDEVNYLPGAARLRLLPFLNISESLLMAGNLTGLTPHFSGSCYVPSSRWL
jgi:hypothetical protein